MGRSRLAISGTPLRGLAAVVAVLAALVVASSAAALPGAVSEARSAEAAILERINEVRQSHGLRGLRLSMPLARAADAHARSMAGNGYFSHTSGDGTSMSSRIERFYRSSGYRRWSVGETLAWRSPGGSADVIVTMWLASPGHRQILLDGSFREVGIAAVHSDQAPGVFGNRAATIFVADFGARS
jgi:uncharacterized protein YkwD